MGRCRPPLVEISKDLLRHGSLKDLAAMMASARSEFPVEFAFAATTDLTTCSGMAWERYRRYLAVQVAQARFLDCAAFRFFAGRTTPAVTVSVLTTRIQCLVDDVSPMSACLEIHGGVECKFPVLEHLLAATPISIVVDFENLRRSGLSSAALRQILPLSRVAYFHQRNLPDVWAEDEASLHEEEVWRGLLPDGPFLWEPKVVAEPGKILDLYNEYLVSHPRTAGP